MARVLCVALPWFRTERLTRSLEAPEEPELAVVLRRSNTLLITGVTQAAGRSGVAEGMTLSAARALLPKLEVAYQDDEAELAALESLAGFVYQFTPDVRIAPPNALLLDITGCERLHGGEDALMGKVAGGLMRLGYTPCLAVADNPTAAMTLALHEPMAIALPGHGDEPFSNVPLEDLRLADRTLNELRDLGLTRVGELLAIPEDTLPHRFGDDVVTRIRQLRGEQYEDFEPWKPVQHIRERLDFTGPTNQYTALLFVLKQGANFLSERLVNASSGARRLEARLVCSDGEDLAFTLDTARPTADAKGLETLLVARFEKLDRGERWFEAFELVVPSHEPLEVHQHNLFEPDGGANSSDFLRLLDELTGRMGKDAVSRAVLTPDPHPRRSFRYVPYRSKEQGADVRAHPDRPVHIDRSRYVIFESDLKELPSWWEWPPQWHRLPGDVQSHVLPAHGGHDLEDHGTGHAQDARATCALRVISGPERVTAEEPTDYFLLEAPDGGRHWVSFIPGQWWAPRELADFREDFKALTACGVTREAAALLEQPQYAELVCCSNFSFLRGASTAEQLFAQAKAAGLHALAIADMHTLAGMVRAHEHAKALEMKLLVGSRVPLTDGPDLCLYAMTRQGYAHLCRLLTLGKRRTEKGNCELHLRDLNEFAGDLQCVVLNADAAPEGSLEVLKNVYAQRLSLAVKRHYEPFDDQRNDRILELCEQHEIPGVAVNDVHWHDGEAKFVQDIQTCIRELVTIDESSGLVFQNHERRLKRPSEVAALWADRPELLQRSVEIADSCTFSLDELRYEYPQEIVPEGMSMQDYLEQETWAGAHRRYGESIPAHVRELLEKELALIEELDYAAYFLTVYDIVKFARSQDILCQGRGSAANSSVCFCLGVTSVDPTRVNLLFERFISRERNEPPDIDIDFEHERREEVLQYIYNKYGRERTGIAATTITYRSKSLVRDIGKAAGLSLDQIDRLSKNIQWWDKPEKLEKILVDAGLNPGDERVQLTVRTMEHLRGYPRHLSQHVGGFVITKGRLDEMVPIENAAMEDRTVIEWNKDDIDSLGILKVDCLSLGMLTACHKAFDLIAKAGGRELDFVRVFESDPEGKGDTPEAKAIYAMLQKADAIGTFQVESRAQMSMLPRLKPREFYDLVVEVAIVRPGPIQGGMVHPYLRRRNGEEPIDYPYEPLRPVLEKTFGVPLFQEQAMQIAVVAAGYTPGEADQLRRDMGSWRRTGAMAKHRPKLIEGMAERGISEEYAERIFQQIAGFGEYGFPESHAASFALITYVTCFLKRFYPAALTAALVNSQPMGFYSISSLIRDARNHGVAVLPVDVNVSGWDCALEAVGAGLAPPAGDASVAPTYSPAPLDADSETWGEYGPAIRMGMRVVKGLSEETARAIEDARREGGKFKNVPDLVRRVSSTVGRQRWRHDLHKLATADAFRSMGLSRREALWEIRGYSAPVPDLFKDLDPVEKPAPLPGLSEIEQVTSDYRSTGLSLRAHPVSFLRGMLEEQGVIPTAQLRECKNGARVEVAGITITYQRPATAGGITFVTLEDETDVANLVAYKDFMEANRKVLLGSRYLVVSGKVEKQGDVIHVKVEGVRSLDNELPDIKTKARKFR